MRSYTRRTNERENRVIMTSASRLELFFFSFYTCSLYAKGGLELLIVSYRRCAIVFIVRMRTIHEAKKLRIIRFSYSSSRSFVKFSFLYYQPRVDSNTSRDMIDFVRAFLDVRERNDPKKKIIFTALITFVSYRFCIVK